MHRFFRTKSRNGKFFRCMKYNLEKEGQVVTSIQAIYILQVNQILLMCKLDNHLLISVRVLLCYSKNLFDLLSCDFLFKNKYQILTGLLWGFLLDILNMLSLFYRVSYQGIKHFSKKKSRRIEA